MFGSLGISVFPLVELQEGAPGFKGGGGEKKRSGVIFGSFIPRDGAVDIHIPRFFSLDVGMGSRRTSTRAWAETWLEELKSHWCA
jgi:hypothetical protein